MFTFGEILIMHVFACPRSWLGPLLGKLPIHCARLKRIHSLVKQKKTGGFLECFVPTGDIEADIKYIKKQLSQFKGKYPEKGIKAHE